MLRLQRTVFLRAWLWSGFFMMLAMAAPAQVTVRGQVFDAESKRPLPHAFVINHRTQNGVFADNEGKFTFAVQANDSLLVSISGYTLQKVLLSDSIPKANYQINIYLRFKPVSLRTFTVKAPRTYEQILKELAEAEQRKPRETPLVNAVESPITYLWTQFSKTGKAQRKIAELRAQDAQMDLLRDLFTRYMVAQIISTDENELDDFIRFSGLMNNYNTFDSEYELVSHVKQRWADYKVYRGMED